MGEIADMMVDGEMCPCGEYLGDGPGFPQYCSEQCERDFGFHNNQKLVPGHSSWTMSEEARKKRNKKRAERRARAKKRKICT